MDKIASSSSGLLARALVRSSAVSTTPLFRRAAGPIARPCLCAGVRALSGTAARRSEPPRNGTDVFKEALESLAQAPNANASTPAAAPSGTASNASDASNASNARNTKTTKSTPASGRNLMEGLVDLLPASKFGGSSASGAGAGTGSSGGGLEEFDQMKREVDNSLEEYHLAVYSHKHNTHVTVSKPNHDVILSLSCGNLGFRKAQRGSYDAAYQLGAYVCDRLYHRGWHNNIQRLSVTLRGFGPGREAVSKVLLGNEGRLLRSKITNVADATRLKFGGTRSKRPRRLG